MNGEPLPPRDPEGPADPDGTPVPWPPAAGARVDPAVVFGIRRPLVGMVHLAPLPGAPGWGGSMRAVVDRALRDAEALARGGMDGILVENYGDAPFVPGTLPPAALAALTVAVDAVRRAIGLPVGVNALRNDARGALGVAVATGAGFIRVNVHVGSMFTDQGLLHGAAHRTLRERAALSAPVAIFADALVKHATPPHGLSLEEAARDAWERGRADAVVVSGPGTGRPTEREDLLRVRRAVPDAPLWIGSGLTPGTAVNLLPLADGAIVGSALQTGGRAGSPVDEERVRVLVGAARSI